MVLFVHSHFVENAAIDLEATNPSFLTWFCHKSPFLSFILSICKNILILDLLSVTHPCFLIYNSDFKWLFTLALHLFSR
jgi:hypothetical protein